MTTAQFNPNGGAIAVAVACTPNRNGSYSILLWKAGENTVVNEWKGNFLNSADDKYDLAVPCTQHHKRILEGIIVVAIPGGVGPSDVTMTVSQDGRELAREKRSVPPGSPGQTVDLFITLASA